MKENQPKTAHQATEDAMKAFVNGNGNATLVCPECSAVKSIAAEQYRGRIHNLKVRCNCSYVFAVNLDFRQNYRRATNLSGSYTLFPPAYGEGDAQIKNLSLNGACFSISTGLRGLDIGSRGRLNFTLDDRKKTKLIREFIVKHVQENVVGCRFRKDQAFEKELGFYLRFGP